MIDSYTDLAHYSLPAKQDLIDSYTDLAHYSLPAKQDLIDSYTDLAITILYQPNKTWLIPTLTLLKK